MNHVEHLPCQGHERGPYIATYSGLNLHLMDPTPDEICIEDIAHHLSLQCRFSGACPRFYSVAEHSVLVSLMVPPEDALWGLLHDASEAYLCDIPRPFKSALGGYYEHEERLLKAVAGKFGLSWPMPKSIKDVDAHMAATEAAILWREPPEWTKVYTMLELPRRNIGYLPTFAQSDFMHRFSELTA